MAINKAHMHGHDGYIFETLIVKYIFSHQEYI